MLIYHLRDEVYGNLSATGGKTVALDIKFPDFNQNSAPLSFTASIGLAICHEDDNYNRKIGRLLALSKLTKQEFKLAYCEDDNISYYTELFVRSSRYRVLFTINKLTKRNKLKIFNVLDLLEDF